MKCKFYYQYDARPYGRDAPEFFIVSAVKLVGLFQSLENFYQSLPRQEITKD